MVYSYRRSRLASLKICDFLLTGLLAFRFRDQLKGLLGLKVPVSPVLLAQGTF